MGKTGILDIPAKMVIAYLEGDDDALGNLGASSPTAMAGFMRQKKLIDEAIEAGVSREELLNDLKRAMDESAEPSEQPA
jgi:hypothetical protein